jgi:DNA-binding NtrC family response regulator
MKFMKVIVIDDEPAIRQILAANLVKAGYEVVQAQGGQEAFELLAKGDIHVAICDIRMPDLDGIELVRRVQTAGFDTNFIMMTAFGSMDTAIEAIKAGASDYMVKPVRKEEVLHRLAKIQDMRGLRAENRALRNMVKGLREDTFLFTSPEMRALDRLVNKVAPTESTVLITGESGTAKGLLARQIHQQSPRGKAPFVPVNCGALPENLIESELFGHLKGAFTGADRLRKGLFLEADTGTIFLDEIGELPLALQVKLLHVIEDKTIRAVGSEQARRADVRIVAATNRDLPKMVADGTFREDLYFRLSVFHIHSPPLRERQQDIPGFVRFLLKRSAARAGDSGELSIDPKAEKLLIAYNWPGNVREMENVLDRAVIMAEEGHITCEDLPAQITKNAAIGSAETPVTVFEPSSDNLRDQVRRYENMLICKAIEDANGDRRVAAQKLGVGLSSLYRKLEEFESLQMQQNLSQ